MRANREPVFLRLGRLLAPLGLACTLTAQPQPSPAPLLSINLGPGATGELSLDSIADVTGDGNRDLIVGMPTRNEVRLYDSGTGALLATFVYAAPGAGLGTDVCSIGDLDGNGVEEIVAGAATQGNGAAVVLSYRPGVTTLSQIRRWTLTASHQTGVTPARYGWRVARGPDVTGDGIDEVLIAAPMFDPLGGALGPTGRIEAINVAPLTPRPLGAVVGTSNTTELGSAVDRMGDLNGDGVAEVLVGAAGNLPGGPPSNRPGEVLVFSGASFLGTPTRLGLATGTAIHDQTGYCVSGTPDLNFDNVPDCVSGQPGLVGAPSGEVAFDGSTLSTTPQKLHNTADPGSERFGHAIAVVRDYTLNGVPELLIGAPSDTGTVGLAWIIEGATGVVLTYVVHPTATATMGIDVTELGGPTRGYAIGDAGARRVHIYF